MRGSLKIVLIFAIFLLPCCSGSQQKPIEKGSHLKKAGQIEGKTEEPHAQEMGETAVKEKQKGRETEGVKRGGEKEKVEGLSGVSRTSHRSVKSVSERRRTKARSMKKAGRCLVDIFPAGVDDETSKVAKDGKIDGDEEGFIKIKVYNKGDGVCHNLHFRVFPPPEVLITGSDERLIKTLSPGDKKTFKISYYAKDNPGEKVGFVVEINGKERKIVYFMGKKRELSERERKQLQEKRRIEKKAKSVEEEMEEFLRK